MNETITARDLRPGDIATILQDDYSDVNHEGGRKAEIPKRYRVMELYKWGISVESTGRYPYRESFTWWELEKKLVGVERQ